MAESTSNPYIFGDPVVERQRLESQSQVFGEYIQNSAHQYVGLQVRRILDVGCGEAQHSFRLQSIYPGSQLTGIDRDANAIAKAESHAGDRDARFIQGDIQDGLPAGKYDLITAFTVLEHMPRYGDVLDLMVEHLERGGHLWVMDAAPDCFDYYPNPDYQKAIGLYKQAMKALGNNLQIMADLPQLLADRGLVEVKSYTKDFTVGGLTTEGQNILAAILGGFYSARSFLSKMTGVAEDEIGEMLEGIAKDALLNPNPSFVRMMSVVARKPGV